MPTQIHSTASVLFRAASSTQHQPSESFFPFDGTCKASCDANFELTFDDGAALKVSNKLLEEASPHFQRALRDCNHNQKLHLQETTQEAWILIANFLHLKGNHGTLIQQLITSKNTIVIVSFSFEKSAITVDCSLDRYLETIADARFRLFSRRLRYENALLTHNVLMEDTWSFSHKYES